MKKLEECKGQDISCVLGTEWTEWCSHIHPQQGVMDNEASQLQAKNEVEEVWKGFFSALISEFNTGLSW